ncbi:MAG: hypothetical protein RLZZ206_2494 [Cyanobacteriota bacterium]|jgi:hypothetical protein
MPRLARPMVIFRAGLTQADGLGWIAVQFSEDGFGMVT